MALVQWKQISPQLGDYGQLTGSLEITGSFILNGQELDLSGGVISSNQTLSLNGYELSISNGNTVTLPQGGGSADTGSLITSASAVGNVITFTYGDGSTQSVTVDTGSAGSITDITALNTFTSSYYVDSASFDSRIVNTSIDTGSFATTGSNTFVGKQRITGNTDAQLTVGNSSVATGWNSVAFGYATTASGHESFAAGFNTRAIETGSTALGGDTLASGFLSFAQGQYTTASGNSSHAEGIGTKAVVNYQHVEGKYNIPNSSSILIIGDGTSDINRSNVLDVKAGNVQITGSLNVSNNITGNLTGTSSFALTASYALNASSIDTGSLLTTASYQIDSASFNERILNITSSGGQTTDITAINSFTSSYYIDSASVDSRLDSLEVTGSIIAPFAFARVDTTSNGSGTGISWANWNFLNGTLEFSFTTTQPDTNYIVVTDGELNDDGRLVSIQNKTVNGFQASFYTTSGVTTPSGVSPFSIIVYGSNPTQSVRVNVSGSSNVDLTALNSFTSSYYIDSASFNTRILNITSSGGSANVTFDGNRVVSNTLLGDLYTDGFNAGTTGSIQDFLTAVFFPTEAPTATFTDQTSNFNTNLATNGTNLVSVALTDTVDNSPYSLVLSGTNGSSLTAVATNAASSSWEIQANGNLAAGTYTYDVTVGDSTNATRTYSSRTLTIAQASSGTLSTTGNFYIIESATTGPIYLNSNGRTGAQGGVTVSYSPNYGSQVATNFSSTNPFISINSTTGLLSVGTAISGSGNIEGTILNSDISWTDQYGNTSTAPINVQVTRNEGPASLLSNSGLRNTNQATSGSTLGVVTFSDTEGDAINYSSYNMNVVTGLSSDLEAVRVGNTYEIRATRNLPAGSYQVQNSVVDIHGFNRSSYTYTITIAAADDGTLTGDSNIYIVESATTGDVFQDATGFGNGNPAQIGVSYSPNYGSQVATLTSSNPAILVDGLGNLTLGVDLSGSLTQSGATFDSTISWVDQYGNTDSAIITANVFSNQAPSALVVDAGVTSDQAVSGSTVGTLTITDTELNSPYSVTLGGVSGSLFNAVALNAERSSWSIQPFSVLSAGSYPITFTVTDTYGKQSLSLKTFVIESPITDTLYVYDVGQITGTYNNDLGIQSQTTSTPPVPTSYTGFGFLEKIEDGYLSSGSFTYDWGGTKTANLLASASGANVNTLLTDLGTISKSNSNRFVILMPSGSAMTGVPRTTTDSYGGNILDQYVLEVAADGNTIGSGIGTTESSTIHKITLGAPLNGVSDYIMVGNSNTIATATSIELRLIPVSGSAT